MALLPQDPQQQKKILVAIAPLLILFAYWYFLHGKAQAEILTKETRLETLEAVNGPARIQASQGGPELQRKLALYEQHMVRLEQLIPEREEVSDLLYTMTQRAEDAGVDMTTMKPEDEQPGQFYTRQTYEMGVIGSYHRVGQFLASIGGLPRIITPIDVVITTRAQSDRSGARLLNAQFRIETYVVPEPKPAPPPKPATGA